MAFHRPGCSAAAAELIAPEAPDPLQAMRSIGPHIVEKFCNIVKLRNRLAKGAGFEDYYDMKVSVHSCDCMTEGAAASHLLSAMVRLGCCSHWLHMWAPFAQGCLTMTEAS